MKSMLFSLLLCLALSALGQVRDSVYVNFDHDQYSFSRNDIHALDILMNTYEPQYVTKIWLTGHTDSTGNNTYNMALSQKRVQVIANRMVDFGYSREIMEVTALGYHDPLVPETSDEARHRNRRVKVVFELRLPENEFADWDVVSVTGDSTKNNPDPSICPVGTDTININNQPINGLSANKNYYMVSEKTGMAFFIPAKTVATQDEVTWEIRTYNTVQDVINTKMYTSSEGIPLESGGFFEINATINGMDAGLNPQAQITVTIPADKFDPEMRLYTGGSTEAGFNWEEVKKSYYGKSIRQTFPNMRYDEASGTYVITLDALGRINLDKPQDFFTLKIKSRKLINRDEELIAVSKERLTAVKMHRKGRKYTANMALYGDKFEVIHRNRKGDQYVIEGRYQKVFRTNRRTVVTLRLRKGELLLPKKEEGLAVTAK